MCCSVCQTLCNAFHLSQSSLLSVPSLTTQVGHDDVLYLLLSALYPSWHPFCQSSPAIWGGQVKWHADHQRLFFETFEVFLEWQKGYSEKQAGCQWSSEYRHSYAGRGLQGVWFSYCSTDEAMWHVVCGPAAVSGRQKLSCSTNEDGERSVMIVNLNKDLDMTLTLCHSVSLCLCVYVCLEVMSSHLPAVMLWLASSLRACCQQEVSSTQLSHQHAAGDFLKTVTETDTLSQICKYALTLAYLMAVLWHAASVDG